MSIKISLGAMQNIVLHTMQQQEQKFFQKVRKIDVRSSENANIEVTVATSQSNLEIFIPSPYTISKTNAITRIYQHKGATMQPYGEDKEHIPYDTVLEMPLTLQHAIDYLNINIESLAHLSISLRIALLQTIDAPSRLLHFFFLYTADIYTEEECEVLLYYLLHLDSFQQQSFLSLYLTDIRNIFIYIPASILRTICGYLDKKTCLLYSNIHSISTPSPSSLRSKQIRASSSSMPHILTSLHKIRKKQSYTITDKQITYSTPEHNPHLCFASAQYLPEIILLLCSTQKTSIAHKRTLLLLYRMILFYYDTDLSIDITTLLSPIYNDITTMPLHSNQRIPYDLISLALCLEMVSPLSAKQYIHDFKNDSGNIKCLIQYSIFWYLLFSDNNTYSHSATLGMLSILPFYPTISFSTFHRLYSIYSFFESSQNINQLSLFLQNKEIYYTIDSISTATFSHIINRLKEITQDDKMLEMLEKLLLQHKK